MFAISVIAVTFDVSCAFPVVLSLAGISKVLLFESIVASGFISTVTEYDTHFQFYTIIKKYDAKMLSLSDVVQPDSTTTVYDYIRSSLGQKKVMAYFTNAGQEIAVSLDTEANVERKKTGDALLKLLSW